MLGLTLRDEFRGQHLPSTAISLVEPDGTGATQVAPDKILSITYPTGDIQTALRAFHGSRPPRPLVLQGSRGKGKSHLLALLHHAIATPQQVENWANEWAARAGISTLQNLQLPRRFLPISEPVHQGEFKFLWDFIFARHPEGQRFLGQFQASGELFPRKSILEEMFRLRPTALLLDEFQKWFDSLHDQPGTTGIKWRTNAERFIQILSEIACEQPDRLIFAVSVLDNQTEAFRQIHRHHPTIVNFEGASANDDRRKMVLHRLFENRDVIPEADIRNLVSPYGNERFRLLFGNLPEAERPRIVREVIGSWPFAPELLSLLNDQILVSTAAQDERDIIKILTLKSGHLKQSIVKLAIGNNGARNAALESLPLDQLHAPPPNHVPSLDRHALQSLLTDYAAQALHRDLEHHGELNEGAWYSSRLLALLVL
jgi:hypothetical protein